MATCDYPSELAHLIPYPSGRTGLRIDSRIPALLDEDQRQPRSRSNVPADQVGNIFYFIEPRPRNPWAASGSLVFLSLVLLALIVVPLYRTDPLPKREMLTMLYLQPPPAAGATAVKLESPKPASSFTPTTKAMATPLRKTEEAPPAVGTTSGVVGGIPTGTMGAVPIGVFSSAPNTASSVPVLAKSPEPAPVKRMRIASRVAEANLIHDVPPQYPPEAGRARIEGAVVLLALIDKDGTVKDVRVESGLPILAQAAIDAVKQWRYKPYLIDGAPVEVDSRITINFKLSGA